MSTLGTLTEDDAKASYKLSQRFASIMSLLEDDTPAERAMIAFAFLAAFSAGGAGCRCFTVVHRGMVVAIYPEDSEQGKAAFELHKSYLAEHKPDALRTS